MKLIAILPAFAAACALALPSTSEARDKDEKHRGSGNNQRSETVRGDITRRLPAGSSMRRDSDRGRSERRDNDRDRDRDRDRHDHDRGDRHRPSVIVRSYPSYGYGYDYGYRGYRSPYYYSRPSLGFSFYSRPSTVYRGEPIYGSYSDRLAADVQRELRRRGYYRGPIDGDIGPGSRAAIRAYQYDRGLAATGRIDSSLLRSLGIG